MTYCLVTLELGLHPETQFRDKGVGPRQWWQMAILNRLDACGKCRGVLKMAPLPECSRLTSLASSWNTSPRKACPNHWHGSEGLKVKLDLDIFRILLQKKKKIASKSSELRDHA